MNLRPTRALVALPLAALLPVAFLACEIAVNLNAPFDGAVSDILDCGICADVSTDADYDAPDVSIYGLQPPADTGSDAAVKDAHGATHD